mmetsp:Transcript_24842/g.42055  ORF Transcript_24842/g.42055 Transcript_24842/m.42055 type:complete len:154 (-) Transcript_24842:99-560(-)|eukprot:CAMPEP_0114457868 /NCGR_PEP_ID=MMETSP0104-20121206/4386_1 /TAXON_ID=37642 ORGANISM="Paraphysomonas imperforata, Strain PA2" /NCGR_SAMPLE_ID=MMETSP0104 /ASSEMBLY_ACC=CAM_ASM_000202 /LENGTH=153 /DNA_ID=CAMNT_0001630431 /DNA_START=44 /DNA_END=505 /DNA_ORIENTATION=-
MWAVKLLKYLAANTTVVNAYVAADLYGFPRLYRRVLEVLKADTHLSQSQKKVVASNIKHAIRVPSSAYTAILESHTVAFLAREAEALANTTNVHVPPAAIAVAEMLFKRTQFGRAVDVLKRAAAQRDEDKKRKAMAKANKLGLEKLRDEQKSD